MNARHKPEYHTPRVDYASKFRRSPMSEFEFRRLQRGWLRFLEVVALEHQQDQITDIQPRRIWLARSSA